MERRFYLVDAQVLPEVFLKVVRAKELLASGDYFSVLDELARRDKRVFVDLKFFDIPATVAGVIRGLSRWPVTYATLHGWHAGMMRAAADARSGELRLLAVTVLTSMDGHDLSDAGYHDDPATLVLKRARQARAAGMGGIVCSAAEAEAVRDIVGPDMAVVTQSLKNATLLGRARGTG